MRLADGRTGKARQTEAYQAAARYASAAVDSILSTTCLIACDGAGTFAHRDPQRFTQGVLA